MSNNRTRNLNINVQAPNSLNIAYWNAAGIRNKITELECFLRRHKIDIMMIIETRLDPANNIDIDGYICYLVPNSNNFRKGGVATLIRQSIRHAALESISTDCVQCAPILVHTSLDNSNAITVSPIYCPPTFNWSRDHFSRLFHKLDNLSQGARLLVCGDWNAKSTWWGNVRSCRRGKALLDTIQASQRLNILATGGATHYPANRRNRPSAIDFAVYAGIHNEALNTCSSIDLDSDHLPIHIRLSIASFTPSQTNRQLLPKYANTRTFQQHLENSIHIDTELRSGTDVEEAVTLLNRNIYAAAVAATPPPRPVSLRSSNSQIKLSDATKNLLRLKRHAKRDLMLHHTDVARQNYRNIQNRLKKALKKDKGNTINAILEQVDTRDRYRLQKLWRITNKLKRQPQSNWPLKVQTHPNQPPVWTKTCQEKAEVFANHLEQRFSPAYSNSDSDRAIVATGLEQGLRSYQQLYDQTNTAETYTPFTVAEIQHEINALTPKKSYGWDKISNIVLKKLPSIAVQYLALIFNGILRYGHFPQQWKLAAISMILKPSKCCNEVVSYRPISLLSSFSKLFEKLLMHRLFNEDNFCLAIPNHQFGFRREHGTDQQLFRVTQFILKAFEEHQICSAVYIDISEAFDRVWHEGLLCKLVKILPRNLFNVLQSYLSDREFLVKGLSGVTSRIYQIRAGVPQGSVLGPILYAIYTSDMPLPNLNTSCRLLLSTFADDTVILAASQIPSLAVRQNQAYLDRLQKWANYWCIKINTEKTAHVMHTLRRINYRHGNLTLKLNGCDISNVSRHRYLGLHLDTRLNLKFHTSQLCVRLKALAHKLGWLISRHSKLTKRCKTLVYKQLIAPVWHYALPIWGALVSTTQLRRIDTLQNKLVRKATNAPWFTRNQTLRDKYNITSADEFFNSSSQRLANSLASHPNHEARQLILHPYEPNRLQRSRLSFQLQNFIIPLQSSISRPQPEPHIPTLIRMAEEERARNNPTSSPPRIPEYPPYRLYESLINSLARRYRNGLVTREFLVERLQYQHYNIQRLVLPDFIIMEQRGPPEHILRQDLLRHNQQPNEPTSNLSSNDQLVMSPATPQQPRQRNIPEATADTDAGSMHAISPPLSIGSSESSLSAQQHHRPIT